MTAISVHTRDGFLLTLACLGGAIVAPVVPVVGFPTCAAALAGLVYRGMPKTAVAAAVLSIAAAGLLQINQVLAVAPALAAMLIVTNRLRDTDALTIAAALIPLLALGFAASEFAGAWLLGLSVREYYTEAFSELQSLMQAAGTTPVAGTESLVDTMIRFAPAGYLILAAFTVVPSVAAAIWAARRSGASVRTLPRLDRLDLSPHVLWPLVGAIGLLAAGRATGESGAGLTTAGLNLLIAARLALTAQGLGCVSALMRATGIGRVGRIVGYAVALVVDAGTLAISVVGLSDFWFNFRRLSRDGEQGRSGSKSDIRSE